MGQPRMLLCFDDDDVDDDSDDDCDDDMDDGETFALSDKADQGCRSASPSARCSRQSWTEIKTIKNVTPTAISMVVLSSYDN